MWYKSGVGLLKYCGRTGTEAEIKTSQSSYFYEGANKMFRTRSEEWEGRNSAYLNGINPSVCSVLEITIDKYILAELLYGFMIVTL